ncbi:hypothetical protein [Herbaspirillum autotrophicum]|uniref:hypothetical protein n=1 Tax=Herbaspirillum autotrophicum TaxID=180195 RepID=UPI0012EEAC1A|nr:hypothetical protein [Herbaspirillum autotrophicum]
MRKSAGRSTQKTTQRQSDLPQKDIASLIASRVSIIDPDDPQRERKAFKVFLESVLIAELGDTLANDPAFYTMVEAVQQQMESDPELAKAIRSATKLLLPPTEN